MDPGVRSARVDKLFAESATLSRYLEVEAALAACQAQLGIIPERAARSIAAFARAEKIDRAEYRQDFEAAGFPIVGLVRQLAKIVPEGDGEFAHWGATTQDIMDTGLVLALRDILVWVEESLDGVIANLVPLAEQHRRTVMIGRSQMQHAVPITFGYKVAGWLSPLLRHRCRLAEVRARLLQVQFGGAVGTLASLGAQGFEVRRLFAERLRLGEITLAKDVVANLEAGMLCLADRNFLGFELWERGRARQADLLWRGKKSLVLPCDERLADGSYLSRIYPSLRDRRKDTGAVVVRVIEYELEGVSGAEPFYRLITTILDPGQAPARELAALYHERWEIETALDELKTQLRGSRIVLRSKTPELVKQEFHGLMMAHFAIRGLMHEAALKGDIDPDGLSFIHAVRIVRRKLPQSAAIPPSQEEGIP